MQAHPAPAPPRSAVTAASGGFVLVTGALRAVESLLLRGGQRTARRNAWTAVLEDRKRARARREAQSVLDRLGRGYDAGPEAR
ncbi:MULTISPECIES: SCO2195 family GlnR-regulated protein [Streptomycetaceae]|uniref:Uncharacterized protein n=1 Tax=Streptantibioticus cattleyicolor (strain ATCC 35852 / DSM 46488 / JCM 4925 / NBRC 14057 / NRRL 8057) TaxID=1003195 RepID=F8K1Z4_STREN|nr:MULTISPECIES: hypothetical protein [Streptomycetaceae]AEW93685.1 hypothetical protein SCATT_13140 [Streptantibioticus cattleyicolor NRRL 8057 = DSM 46488]MYS58385.1 hypothetical protein [Streptomyces sp. SID5468]CCB74036.1 protein of unknown function [Streptantibioticus cattleyicolor NRRL 8057 = DSM 46488]